MGVLCIVLALIMILAHSVGAKFNVRDYGAVGNGLADDTQAFSKVWSAACGSTVDTAKIIVPKGGTFRVKPIKFQGQCKTKNIIFQVDGAIVAPGDPREWKGAAQWIVFQWVNHLTLRGSGSINGRGKKWWAEHCKRNSKPGCIKRAPYGLKFSKCNDLSVSGLKFRDSPCFHISLLSSERVDMRNIKITAPGVSPNTDGIHISRSRHVNIEGSTIQTGDDCISIGDKTYGVNISHVNCGPGHGISIGSLGGHHSEASVEQVHVKAVNFYNTTNGARIKTWQGGRGYVKSVTFEDLTFHNVANPIFIDQFYCDVRNKNCPSERDVVKISDVTYTSAVGTSKTPVAISFNCSHPKSCTGIHLMDINITSHITSRAPTTALCSNAHGDAKGCISPKLENCLKK